MKAKAGGRNETGFKATLGTDEKDFCGVARDKFTRDSESRNDVAACAAAGDENPQGCQTKAFQR